MNKFYLGEFEYFATGEGHQISAAIFLGPENTEQARRLFFDKYIGGDQSEYDYFKIGIDLKVVRDRFKCYSDVLKESKILKLVTSPAVLAAIIEMVEVGGFHDEAFVFRLKYNLS